MCGQQAPTHDSGCLKHRISIIDGVEDSLRRKANGVGAGNLWLLGDAGWVCWHRGRSAVPRFGPDGNPLAESLQRSIGPSVPTDVSLSGAQDSYGSHPQGSRGLITIYTNWDSAPCILNPATEDKNSSRCLNVLGWVEHSCSADLNGAIHTLTARRALKYVAESALMCVLKYNSDFCNQGQCQALVHPCLESRY